MSAPKAAGRWLALDLLRFCAVALMVQGHTFTSLLDRAVTHASWYPHHRFVHGYTAPMFLFAAGLAFGYTTFRRWDQHTRPGPAMAQRLKRYGWLFVIGYGMHLPRFSLEKVLDLTAEAPLRRLFHVDVLHHIALSLVICQLLILLLRRKEIFVAVVGLLGLLLIFLAPPIWAWPADQHLPLWLVGYVNDAKGSLFPLAPWAGFTYLGIAMAYGVSRRAEGAGAEGVSARVAWPMAIAAALTMGLPVLLNRMGMSDPYGPHNFWKTSPYYFFWRLGNVLAVLAVLCFVERWLMTRAWFREPGPFAEKAIEGVQVMGQESLIIYVVHLLVLHGSVLNRGLTSLLRDSLSLSAAIGVFLLLYLAMALMAWGWNRLKRREVHFDALQWTLVTLLLGLFLSS